MPDPPQGTFAAVADQNAPGRFILYRDVTLERAGVDNIRFERVPE